MQKRKEKLDMSAPITFAVLVDTPKGTEYKDGFKYRNVAVGYAKKMLKYGLTNTRVIEVASVTPVS